MPAEDVYGISRATPRRKVKAQLIGRFKFPDKQHLTDDEIRSNLEAIMKDKQVVRLKTKVWLYDNGIRLGDNSVFSSVAIDFIAYSKIRQIKRFREHPSVVIFHLKDDPGCLLTLIQFASPEMAGECTKFVHHQKTVVEPGYVAELPDKPMVETNWQLRDSHQALNNNNNNNNHESFSPVVTQPVYNTVSPTRETVYAVVNDDTPRSPRYLNNEDYHSNMGESVVRDLMNIENNIDSRNVIDCEILDDDGPVRQPVVRAIRNGPTTMVRPESLNLEIPVQKVEAVYSPPAVYVGAPQAKSSGSVVRNGNRAPQKVLVNRRSMPPSHTHVVPTRGYPVHAYGGQPTGFFAPQQPHHHHHQAPPPHQHYHSQTMMQYPQMAAPAAAYPQACPYCGPAQGYATYGSHMHL